MSLLRLYGPNKFKKQKQFFLTIILRYYFDDRSYVRGLFKNDRRMCNRLRLKYTTDA